MLHSVIHTYRLLIFRAILVQLITLEIQSNSWNAFLKFKRSKGTPALSAEFSQMENELRGYWSSEAERLTAAAAAAKTETDTKIELDQSCGPLVVFV